MPLTGKFQSQQHGFRMISLWFISYAMDQRIQRVSPLWLLAGREYRLQGSHWWLGISADIWRDFRKSLNIIVAVIVNGFEPRLLGRSGLWNRFLWCRINYALSHYFKGSQTTFTTVTQATQILWKEYFEALHVTLVHKNISSIVGCEDVCFHWQNQ